MAKIDDSTAVGTCEDVEVDYGILPCPPLSTRTIHLVRKEAYDRLLAQRDDLLAACRTARNGLILLRHGEKTSGHLVMLRDEMYHNALLELKAAIARAEEER